MSFKNPNRLKAKKKPVKKVTLKPTIASATETSNKPK
jgi:hypothetical protein